MITISDKCTGCGKCVKICPFGSISIDNKMAIINETCALCGACVQSCAFDAIQISRKDVNVDLTSYKGVWVFVELLDGKAAGKNSSKIVRSVTYELLSAGRALANDLDEDLSAVLIGNNVEKFSKELASYDADKVYLVENPLLEDYNTDTFTTVMVALITKHKPGVVLYPSTYIGRDLAPRVATELHVGLTADCTGLSIKEGNLLQTRPAFSGNIMANILCPETRPQMATVRPNVMKTENPKPDKKAELIKENIPITKSMIRVKTIEKKYDERHGVEKIDNANIVISGGRGMSDKNGFKILQNLANTLGAAVGASRAAVDMGLKPKPHQVGQSGSTVSPTLYLACGISGAIQHIVGMDSSDVIIAVNKDPNAAIFNVCKYGIVGDVNKILPKLIETLNKKK